MNGVNPVEAALTRFRRSGMYRRIAYNSAILAGGTAAASLLMMLAIAVAARSLRPRDFGVLVLLQAAVLMVGALTSFSTQQPVIKLGSDAQADGDRRRLGDIISMAFMVDLAAAVLAFGIAAVAILGLRGLVGLADRDVGAAWIIAGSLLFTGYPTSNGIFRLYNRFGLLSIVQTLAAAGLLGGYVFLHGIPGVSLTAFVWVWAAYSSVNSVAQLLLSIVLLRRDGVPLSFRLAHFRKPDGRTLIDYCWSTWGTSTAQTLRSNGDSLMVGAIVSVEAAGLYTVARQLAGTVRKFVVVYTSTVFPEIARLSSRGDLEGARRLNRRMLWAALAAGVAGTALAAAFGKPLIRLLFGPHFLPAYWALIIMTAAAFAHLASTTPSMCVQAFRGPKLLLALHLAGTAFFLATAAILTSILSIDGMAAAQLGFGIAMILMCNRALASRSAASSPS